MKKKMIYVIVAVGMVVAFVLGAQLPHKPEQPATWRSEIAPPAPEWTEKFGDSDGAVLAYYLLKMDWGQAKRFADPNLIRVGNKVKIGWDGIIRKGD